MTDPVFREFFGDQLPDQFGQSPNENSLGSGVIVRPDGYILTNNHVIAQADQIVVALHDGRRAEAKVVGTDPDTDLAVIKIELEQLPVLPFKLSGNEVGDVVLAIGNPFGVGQTVTQGLFLQQAVLIWASIPMKTLFRQMLRLTRATRVVH